VSLIHLFDPGSVVLSDHIGVHVPEHFRYFLRSLPGAELPHRERVPELLAVGLLASRLSRIVEGRQLDPKHIGRFECVPKITPALFIVGWPLRRGSSSVW
jgi:hypothetical protein